MAIIPTKNRAELIKNLFPEVEKMTDKAAVKFDAALESWMLNPIPHYRVPNAIHIPRDVIRAQCSHDKALVKAVNKNVFDKVGFHNTGISAPRRIKTEFAERYFEFQKEYTPRRSTKITTRYSQPTEHPFAILAPVNVNVMITMESELLKWIDYVGGKTKSKPKRLRLEIDSICESERRKLWCGNYPKHSTQWKNCPLKTSSLERIIANLQNTYLELKSLRDVAVNNSGCIPMDYVLHPCGRHYAVGGRNLQSCSKLVRSICLNGFMEYDIRSTNQTIALHHAITHDLPRETVMALVADKDSTLSQISTDTGTTPDTIKTCLLIIANFGVIKNPDVLLKHFWSVYFKNNDGTVRENQLFSSIARAVLQTCRSPLEFRAKYLAMFGSSFIQEYHNEMQTIGRSILSTLGNYQTKGKKDSQALSFYNMRIEAQAMKAMYAALPTARVSIFDAVVSEEATDSIHSLEQQIQVATGINFQLKQTLIHVS